MGRDGQPNEHKTAALPGAKLDEAQGIVEHIIAVFGNVDEGGDRIHPGSFAKTLSERGHKIRVLDQHQTDSVLRAIGKPLALQEVDRAGLPMEIQQRYPEATGGVKAVTRFLLDTPEGAGAFTRLREGVIGEWSFGYDAVQADYSNEDGPDGKSFTVRNLREVKLYEYGPVLWGMNPATMTVSAKAGDGGQEDRAEDDSEPEERKPWDVFAVEGEFCVFKVDADGERTGDTLGCHPTEDEARQQVEALYASEDTEDTEDAAPPPPEEKAGRRVRADRVDQIKRLREAMSDLDDLLKWAEYGENDNDKGGGPPASTPPTSNEAGPDADSPDAIKERIALLDLRIRQFEMEVG
ncbi:MAG: HK97 family phage prohead protease [Gammaproteobacteria bacterium]|nr:HK97 family phage prohead protease [Gammaproteobacteria bacterium]